MKRSTSAFCIVTLLFTAFATMAQDVDVTRLRALREKSRSGTPLTSQEQSELDRARNARAAGQRPTARPKGATAEAGKRPLTEQDDPNGTVRLRELRVKSRGGKLTPEEQAELSSAMEAREWANRPKLAPPVLPERNQAPPQQFYADNERGDDTVNGLAAKAGSSGSGPVRSLARAVSLLKPGDTLHLAANATPYRESLVLNDVSGTPDQRIVIDGHGATITGCDPLRADWVEGGAQGLYRSDQLLSQLQEAGDEAKLQRIFLLFNGIPQRMGRTSKGAKAPFKQPGGLQPGEWTYEETTKTFFVKVAGNLADAKVEAPYRRNGVTIRGRSGVSHVVIRNLVCAYVLNDGFNLHGVGTGIRFENIAAYANGDDGFSPHEVIESTVDGYWASKNSTGIGLGNLAVTRISNAHFEGNYAYDFALAHATVTELKSAVIITSEAAARPFGIINPQGLKVVFDNVQIFAEGRSRFEVPARSTFRARHLTAIVPTWAVGGEAEVSESAIGGRLVECKAPGSWKGEKNIYGVDTRLRGIEDPTRTLGNVTSDALRAKQRPFATSGSDRSTMKIPPCPWSTGSPPKG